MKFSIDQIRSVNGLAPVADAFSGTVYSAAVKMTGIGKLVFAVLKGVGTTGTSTITVLASDDASKSNTTAIPFTYKRVAADNTTIGSTTRATAAGFTTTAGSADHYLVEVDAQDLASTGYGYAVLKAVESVDSPVVGGIVALGFDLRYAPNTSDIVS